MRGSSFQTITFIRLTPSCEEKAFPITMMTYAICVIHTVDKGEAYSWDKHLLSPEMLQQDYDCKGSVEKSQITAGV
jgi:hypothetical protein